MSASLLHTAQPSRFVNLWTKYLRNGTKDGQSRKSLQEWEDEVRQQLDGLEQTMDPLPARMLYNCRYSKIYSLQPEILHCIFEYLMEDDVAFFMILRVSRRFRHAASHPLFTNCGFNMFYRCQICAEEHIPQPNRRLRIHEMRHSGLHPGLHPKLVDELRHLLRKSRLCGRCQKDERHDERQIKWGSCKFSQFGAERKQCSGCGLLQSEILFSPTEIRQSCRTRLCIGREGFVKVCDHMTLRWTEVEGALLMMRAGTASSEPLNSSAPQFGQITKELRRCRHESHVAQGCDRVQQGPTVWLTRFRNGFFRIQISWVAHSGRGKFSVSRPGQQPGTLTEREMRNMFLHHRENGAHHIVPPLYPGHLPEMVCFKDRQCDCIDYQCHESISQTFSSDQVPEHRKLAAKCGDRTGTGETTHETYSGTVRVRQCSSPPNTRGQESPCIITAYRREIRGHDPGNAVLVPPHEWYHAIDRASYKWKGLRVNWETCDDPSCLNFYEGGLNDCRKGSEEVDRASYRYLHS